MDITHNAVAKSLARSKIKRLKHENYVSMYIGWAFTNVVNRPIGAKLYQVRRSSSI